MLCKNCRYFSGIQCHGHGEYWGTCRLLEDLNYELKNNRIPYLDVTYENVRCKIIENLNDAKKLRDKKYMEYFNEKSEIIYKALKAYEIPKEEWNRQYKEKIKNRTIEDYKKILNIDK